MSLTWWMFFSGEYSLCVLCAFKHYCCSTCVSTCLFSVPLAGFVSVLFACLGGKAVKGQAKVILWTTPLLCLSKAWWQDNP